LILECGRGNADELAHESAMLARRLGMPCRPIYSALAAPTPARTAEDLWWRRHFIDFVENIDQFVPVRAAKIRDMWAAALDRSR
jgi:hypothetical protein